MNGDPHPYEAVAGPAHGHVVPAKVLIAVWLVLMILTVLTVAVTYVDFGSYNLFAALLIAVFKASLVLLYFMHLRYDSPFHSLLMISALVFVGVFIAISMLDTVHYQDTFHFPIGSAVSEQSVPR